MRPDNDLRVVGLRLSTGVYELVCELLCEFGQGHWDSAHLSRQPGHLSRFCRGWIPISGRLQLGNPGKSPSQSMSYRFCVGCPCSKGVPDKREVGSSTLPRPTAAIRSPASTSGCGALSCPEALVRSNWCFVPGVFWANALATAVGSAIGVSIGLFYDRWKERKARAEREETRRRQHREQEATQLWIIE